MKICWIKKINVNKSNRLVYIVISCFIIAIILIVINFYLVNQAADEARKDIVDYFVLDNIEDIGHYKLEYDATIFGNKTINRYKINEEYQNLRNEGFNFKFNTVDENNIKMAYEITDNSIKIYSDNQISQYNIDTYQTKKTNIYSLYTFLNIYYSMKNDECDCSKYIYDEEYENFLIFGIKFEDESEGNIDIDVKEFKEILKEKGLKIKKIELQINKENMLPTRYVGYDNDGNSCFEIVYNSVIFD